MASNDGTPKYEGLKAWSTFFGTVIIPIAVAIVGGMISTSIKEKDIRLQYIQLAVSILRTKPADEPSQGASQLRQWSIDILNEYSDIPLPPEAAEDLKLKELSIKPIEGWGAVPVFPKQETPLSEKFQGKYVPTGSREKNK
jgi:hypothetical protein